MLEIVFSFCPRNLNHANNGNKNTNIKVLCCCIHACFLIQFQSFVNGVKINTSITINKERKLIEKKKGFTFQSSHYRSLIHMKLHVTDHLYT